MDTVAVVVVAVATVRQEAMAVGMVVLQVYMLFVHRPAAHHVIHSFLGGYAGYRLPLRHII